MVKKIVLAVWIFALAISTIAAQGSPKFDQLKSKFADGLVFNAYFVHEYNDTFTGEQQRTDGFIWVGTDQYKIESGDNVMVVDGEISRVYDNNKNRVITSDYEEEEDDFAPSRMLQGVDDSYSVTEHTHSDGSTEILLSSDDPFAMFLQVTIFLNPDGIPVQIEAIDQVENELITYFENGEFTAASEDTFTFTYPENAEQIDLRHGS